jgi:cytochrome c oxidase cbb3-type subunit 3
MRTRSAASVLVLLLALIAAMAATVAACKREQRNFDQQPPARAAVIANVTIGDLRPGGTAPPPGNTKIVPYEENAYSISEGKRLFEQMNCSGCHFHGGGGIGPPLMDDEWIYGSAPENIFASIIQGRPNGMPSFRDKIPDQQVWQIVAYVRSLGRYVPKDAAPGREDHMQTSPQEQSQPTQPPKNTGSPP